MAFDTASSEVSVIRVDFPNTQAVFALGTFNDWSTTATPLCHRTDGSWATILPRKANLQGLCFFVINLGETFGRIQDWGLAKMGQGQNARAA